MKFLHTADWQIGMKAVHVGASAGRVRDERLGAARRAVDAARRAEVDFILVAGDTFENNGVDRVLIQKVVDILNDFRGPVYMIPGNHDHLGPGSVWEHPAWKTAGQVVVLREAASIEVPGGTLYPCPIRDRYSRKDPTEWIEKRETDSIRIGLAHGTLLGIESADSDHPVDRNAPVRSGLDYLALGHWHSLSTYRFDDAIRMAYSGTHEPTGFGERDSGSVLIVEIESRGAAPVITPVRTGGLRWLTLRETLRQPGDLRRVREIIEQVEDPPAVLLEVSLDGMIDIRERDELDRIREILASRFLFGRMDHTGVRLFPEDESWIETLPSGVLREVAMRLKALSDPARHEGRPEGATPETASLALLELYALLAESSHDSSIADR